MKGNNESGWETSRVFIGFPAGEGGVKAGGWVYFNVFFASFLPVYYLYKKKKQKLRRDKSHTEPVKVWP